VDQLDGLALRGLAAAIIARNGRDLLMANELLYRRNIGTSVEQFGNVRPLPGTSILDATVRLIKLLGAPSEARLLLPLIKRENVYRLLLSEQRGRMAQVAALSWPLTSTLYAFDAPGPPARYSLLTEQREQHAIPHHDVDPGHGAAGRDLHERCGAVRYCSSVESGHQAAP
jgi:hypothetical protein